MIGQYFKIPEYDWDITVYYNVTKYDIDFCIKQLNKLTTLNKYKRECIKTIYSNKKDRAYTYSSFKFKSSIVFIGVSSSTGELINTITHEANHIKSHIATVYGLDEKDEDVCYIIGEVVEEMSKVFVQHICNKNLLF